LTEDPSDTPGGSVTKKLEAGESRTSEGVVLVEG